MAFLTLTTGYTCSTTSSLCSFSAYVFPFATGCPVSHVSHQLNCSVLTIRFPTLSTGYMFPMLAISYMFPGIMLWPMNGIFHKFWPKLLTLYRVDHYFFKGGGGKRGGVGEFPKRVLAQKIQLKNWAGDFYYQVLCFTSKNYCTSFCPPNKIMQNLQVRKKLCLRKLHNPLPPKNGLCLVI